MGKHIQRISVLACTLSTRREGTTALIRHSASSTSPSHSSDSTWHELF